MPTNIRHLRSHLQALHEHLHVDTAEEREDRVQALLKLWPAEAGDISDGYHTFDELYMHRVLLFIALCKAVGVLLRTKGIVHEEYYCCQDGDIAAESWPSIWWSRQHHPSDDDCFPGYVIVGASLGAQITYHMADSYISLLQSAKIPELEHAPKWDGHTSEDVILRLTEWCQ